MQIHELRSMVSQDIPLRQDRLDAESIRIPALHDKYLTLYLDELGELRRMERAFKLVLKQKTEYYLGKADPDTYKDKPFDLKVRPIKSDLSLYLDADEDLQRLQEIMSQQDLKVKYLDSTLKNIHQRSYQIHGALEWAKFQNGLDTIKTPSPFAGDL